MPKLGYAGLLSPDGNQSNYRIAHTLYGVCETIATTATKVIELRYDATNHEINPTLEDDWLLDGMMLIVTFKQANTATNVRVKFPNQTASYILHASGAQLRWLADTTYNLTFRDGRWVISGLAPNGSIVANTMTANKFIGQVDPPHSNVTVRLSPSVASQNQGWSTDYTIRWAQIGPLVTLEGVADLPETPAAQLITSHGEQCVQFNSISASSPSNLWPPRPITLREGSAAGGDPGTHYGMALTRQALGINSGSLIHAFAKYRNYTDSGSGLTGVFEIFNNSGSTVPFSFTYITDSEVGS